MLQQWPLDSHPLAFVAYRRYACDIYIYIHNMHMYMYVHVHMVTININIWYPPSYLPVLV